MSRYLNRFNLILMTALVILPGVARADEVTTLMDQAKQSYRQQNYGEAALKLEQAQRIIKTQMAGKTAADLPVEISITKASISSGFTEHPYPRLEGYITLLKPHKDGYEVQYKLKCSVNGKKRVGSSSVMVLLKKLEVGEETKWDGGLIDYDMRGVGECEATFVYGPMFGRGQSYVIWQKQLNFR